MSYEKQTWIDNQTPLDAEHMNHIEAGIAAAHEEIAGKPRVFIDGVIPTTKDDVLSELTYEHGPERWHAYITIKCQGSSSMSYPKKNFTIKLYSDEARTVKLKKKMFGWPVAQYKYVLKANWIDHTHARNIVTARLWSEVVSSRPDYESLPEEMRNSPNNGAIDGYPVIVYTNGTYQGLYTWNIGKDDWMWGMNEDNPNHVLMCGETNTDGLYNPNPCQFRELWSGVNEEHWSIEVGTNSDALKNSVNALVSCVKGTTSAEFKAQIGNYLDVQSAIDYYLLTCAACGIDNLAKNMLLGTFDLTKWYCGQYDLDSTWLIWWDGSKFLSANTDCPGGYQERFSLLWSRLQAVYWSELRERGRELRKTVLSYANIMSHFERFCAGVGAEAYTDDLVAYPGIPSADANNIWQLRNAVRDRLVYFDAWLEAIPEGIECEGITISQTEASVGVDENITLTATVTPSNTTDEIRWATDDASVVYSAGTTGYVVGKKDGAATIAVICGKHTATCKVTVGEGMPIAPESYELSAPHIFDGTAESCIDTGMKLMDEKTDLTIAIDVENTVDITSRAGLVWMASVNPNYNGIVLQRWHNSDEYTVYAATDTSDLQSRLDTSVGTTTGVRGAIIVRYAKDDNVITVTSATVDGQTVTAELPVDSTMFNAGMSNVFLGCVDAFDEQRLCLWTGIMHRCILRKSRMSDDEVTAFIDGMNG